MALLSEWVDLCKEYPHIFYSSGQGKSVEVYSVEVGNK